MGKIVIPKHSADVDEMNAVLKIHYDADDWVEASENNNKLKGLIGPNQYKTSYPKKAQVPAYFGFLESKMSGKRIKERRITDAGKKMYEAIINDDIAIRQELLMDAVEKIVFGRNNAGSPSGDSDIEAPDLAIRCIIDTGFCTCQEYAYMIWNLHDNGKKYYDSLSDVVKSRSTGGIGLNSEAEGYKDWKPILALIRWGFLIKANDARQKVMLHPDVQKKYKERLCSLKVYNVDKKAEIVFDEISVSESVDTTVFKPFIISDELAFSIKSGQLVEDVINVEKQHIFNGDNVLFVDPSISRLLAYHGYLINGMKKEGTKYKLSLEKQGIVNKNREAQLLDELREEAKKLDSTSNNIVKDILEYKNCDANIKTISNRNKNIEPINLLIRAITELNYLEETELKFLLYSLVIGNLNYTDAIDQVKNSREIKSNLTVDDRVLNYAVLDKLTDSRLLEWSVDNQKRVLRFNSRLSKAHIEQFKRLMIYAVDISKKANIEKEQENFPLYIKPVFVSQKIELGELSELTIAVKNNSNIVQGDYIVIVNQDFSAICNYIVYQVIEIEKSNDVVKLVLLKQNYINQNKEAEILSDLKEAYNGEH